MNLEEIQNIIREEIGVVLYFSGEDCSVCHSLRPKIKDMSDKNFPQIKQIYIDAKENIEISSHFQVFSIPTIIIFMDGREFRREGRLVSIHQLTNELKRPYDMMTS